MSSFKVKLFSIAAVLATFGIAAPLNAQVLISEIFYDAPGSDNELEWVELFNSGPAVIDLSTYSLGYGGSDYTFSTLQLAGTIAPGEYFVVGGPSSNASNGNPVFDQTQDFSSDIQNSGSLADGVALFDVTAGAITSVTVPIDVVIYGPSNDNNLIDETGNVGAVDVDDALSGSSITFDGSGWSITETLTPGSGSLVGATSCLLGDVDLNGTVNFFDIAPFITVLSDGPSQCEADCDQSGIVNFFDIAPFIAILSGS